MLYQMTPAAVARQAEVERQISYATSYFKKLRKYNQLPRELHADDKRTLEEMGFIFQDKFSDDGLFFKVRFPDWWSLEIKDDHRRIYAQLIDSEEKVRGEININFRVDPIAHSIRLIRDS